MGTYSAEQKEQLLKELKRLGWPVAGALPPGAKPHAIQNAKARGKKREELKKRYGMSDAQINDELDVLERQRHLTDCGPGNNAKHSPV